MKNLKELPTLLTAIQCINLTNGNFDRDIHNLLRYIAINITNGNFNMNTLCCIGKNKDGIMPELEEILKTDTKFYEFLERFKEQ